MSVDQFDYRGKHVTVRVTGPHPLMGTLYHVEIDGKSVADNVSVPVQWFSDPNLLRKKVEAYIDGGEADPSVF